MRYRFNFSIRNAFLLVVLSSLLPASCIVLVTGIEQSRYLESQKEAEVLRQASAFAEIQLRIADSTRRLLATLTALPAFQNGEYAYAREVLISTQAVNQDYLNFSLIDARGIVKASSFLQDGTYLGDRPHFKNVFAKKRFCAGEYFVGLVGATPSFAYAYPLLDAQGEPYGALSAVFRLSSYGELFDSFNLEPDSLLELVDPNGVRLFSYPSRDADPDGRKIQESVWRKIQEGADVGTFTDTCAGDSELFFGYKKLWLEEDDRPFCTVIFATPRRSVTDVSRSITRRNLVSMIVAALAALFISFVLSQILFGRRLSRIGAMADRLRAGELEARVGLKNDDSDLGHIAQALDDMAMAVQKRDAELVEETRRLNRLVEEKEILLREVHHRVKNNLQLTLSLIRLQKNSCASDLHYIQDLEARISAISMVHEMLFSSGDFVDIDIAAYCSRLLDVLRELYSVGDRVSVEMHCEAIRSTLEKAVPFGLLLSELVTNAFKYGVKNGGRLDISLHTEAGNAVLCVADDGPGLPPGFDAETSPGLGFQVVKALSVHLNGEASWTNAGGVRFIGRFPLPL